MKHLFAHRTRSSEWNYGNSGILVMWSNQVSETFCLTQYLDHDCLCNRHLAYGSNKELFSRNIILTMIVCSISTWHIFFPTSATFSRLCFKRESIFKAFSWVDEKLIALVIFKIHCIVWCQTDAKIKIIFEWVCERHWTKKEDKDEDVLESQSHLHGITLTTPAGTPAFSQIAAFDQIMRTLSVEDWTLSRWSRAYPHWGLLSNHTQWKVHKIQHRDWDFWENEFLREAVSSVERLQGKHHFLVQSTEGWQRFHGCHPGLWRWSKHWSPQNSFGLN